MIRVYDEQKNQIITHVIYSKMIIQRHIESFIFMLIIKLRQQILILNKSWMRKHDVNYHKKTNIIEFYFEFCTHSKKIETINKEKNIHFEKKSFLNQSDYFKFNDSIKSSTKLSMIVIKILSRKKVNFNQSTINLSQKTKNRQNQTIESKIRKRLKISGSISMSSKSLIRKKNCQKWISRWSKRQRSTWWINERT